jgi:DNA sulfur modification protein DndB
MKLLPAVHGQVGSWNYYATKMTAGELAEHVRFASDLDQPKVLDAIIQRVLNENRAKHDIAAYLAENKDHFFNSIVVAAWEGNPTFFSVELADDPRFEMIADHRFAKSFGVLRFDGHQKYYALDGQHRLKAIKDLLARETEFNPPPEFQFEEFPVVIVVPKQGERFSDFIPRYRRLFSNLNRYAKAMDLATVIAMDEDDTFAILTRRLIAEHDFFQWFEHDTTSRIRVKGGKNVPETENCLMSIISLYEMNGDLLWSNQRQNERGKLKQFIKLPRQADDLLDSWFAELVDVWNAILEELPMLRNTPTNYRSSAGEDFERDGQMVTNHLLFRPIGLGMLAGVVRRLLDEHPDSSPKEAIKGLSAIEWRLHQAPWRHLLSVYDSEADRWKMRTDKEAQQVAANILDFVTQVQRHDEGTLETLRDNWKDLLQNPEPGYEEDGWQAVRDAAVRFGNARK